MKMIHRDDLADGMVLDSTILAPNHLELIPSGIKLEPQIHHAMLVRWGVESIPIKEGVQDEEIKLLPEAIQIQVQIKLQLLFINSGGNSVINQILRAKTKSLLVKEALAELGDEDA